MTPGGSPVWDNPDWAVAWNGANHRWFRPDRWLGEDFPSVTDEAEVIPALSAVAVIIDLPVGRTPDPDPRVHAVRLIEDVWVLFGLARTVNDVIDRTVIDCGSVGIPSAFAVQVFE